MKRIIDGRRYDTDTATHVAYAGSPAGTSILDFRYHDTGLYVTRLGNWFLAGSGGPLTMWARRVGTTGWAEGSGIRPVSASEARTVLEEHGETKMIERYFEVEEA